MLGPDVDIFPAVADARYRAQEQLLAFSASADRDVTEFAWAALLSFDTNKSISARRANRPQWGIGAPRRDRPGYIAQADAMFEEARFRDRDMNLRTAHALDGDLR
jgi:hypothetical protein